MRCRVLLVCFVLGCCVAIGCSSVEQKQSRSLTFASWDSAIEFLQWRHLIPLGEKEREQTKQHSSTRDTNVRGVDFRIIALDWRGKSRFGIRGQNGPIYVFQRERSRYKLAGGFLGSRLDIVVVDDAIVALAYYHVSAAGEPPTKYPFIEGRFNHVDPSARGDVFK